MSSGLDSAGAPLKRHCALCLKEISGEAIKKCAKCHKRAYCSKECQTEDWSPNKKGQGHKNWCGIDCGEEDVDWAVVPVPGKGLGIVALRDIPKAYAIMVEAGVDKSHPGVADLMPLHGSLDEKFAFNQFGLGVRDQNDKEVIVLCLRTSRTNHSCDPNAELYCASLKANILYSVRDIKKGEEICITYTAFSNLEKTETPEMSRLVLLSKWGILCDENCLCYDKAYFEKIQQGRELTKAMARIGDSKTRTESFALAAETKMRELKNDLNMSMAMLKKTLDDRDGFQITVKEMTSAEFVVEFLKEAYELKLRDREQSRLVATKKYKGELFYSCNVRVLPGPIPVT